MFKHIFLSGKLNVTQLDRQNLAYTFKKKVTFTQENYFKTTFLPNIYFSVPKLY